MTMRKLLIVIMCFYGIFANELRFGNVIQFSVQSDSIIVSDTLGSWKSGASGPQQFEQYYLASFDVAETKYLLKHEHEESEFLYSAYSLLLENTQDGSGYIVSHFSGIDVVGNYWPGMNYYQLDNGTWIFNDVFGSGFIDTTGTFYEEGESNGRLYHIVGEVDERHLVAWYVDQWVVFNLLDLSSSPNLNIEDAVQVSFPEIEPPLYIKYITDNLFIGMTHYYFQLYRFENDDFHFIKTLGNTYGSTHFVFRENKIRSKTSHGNVYEYGYNAVDSTLSDSSFIYRQLDFVDHQVEYALNIEDNQLSLFHIPSRTTEKNWRLDHLAQTERPFCNHPDIFIHNTSFVTGILQNEEELIPKTFVVKSYPNPFNGTTTIVFETLRAQTIDIAIIDINGRNVWKQKIENMPEGTHNVKWKADTKASGVYFARIRGEYGVGTAKILLLK
jgi:hypothetical protein